MWTPRCSTAGEGSALSPFFCLTDLTFIPFTDVFCPETKGHSLEEGFCEGVLYGGVVCPGSRRDAETDRSGDEEEAMRRDLAGGENIGEIIGKV